MRVTAADGYLRCVFVNSVMLLLLAADEDNLE